MMKCIMDNPIKFYEKSHKYKLKRKELISVTTLIGKFFEKFDVKKAAKGKAGFHKMLNGKKWKRGEEITKLDKKMATQKYWKADWNGRAERGTYVHNMIEKIITDGVLSVNSSVIDADKKLTYGWHYLMENVSEYSTNNFAEKIIYSDIYGVAGTIDLLIINSDDEATLIDWKTNKKLTSEGYKGKVGIHPLTNELQDCHMVKYGLQLSLYAYILELEYGLKIKSLKLVHLQEDKYVEHEMNYAKEKIIELLEEYKNEN